jgi:hypothetical protein
VIEDDEDCTKFHDRHFGTGLLDFVVFRCHSFLRIPTATATQTSMRLFELSVGFLSLVASVYLQSFFSVRRKSNFHAGMAQEKDGMVAEQW